MSGCGPTCQQHRKGPRTGDEREAAGHAALRPVRLGSSTRRGSCQNRIKQLIDGVVHGGVGQRRVWALRESVTALLSA